MNRTKMSTVPSSPPIRLFYSYAQQDAAHRDSLETHLTLLRRQGMLQGFHDRCILPGSPWKDVLDKQLDEAEVILLLVSPDFVASDYCYEGEMKRALLRHEAGEAVVVPIIVRPTDLSHSPINQLRLLPQNGRPITSWSSQDEAWVNVAEGIRSLLESRRIVSVPGECSWSLAPVSPEAMPKLGQQLMHDLRPLFCDRYRQWTELLTLMQNRRHELVLLPGARGQGHEYFLLRVRTGLPHDPPRRVISVAWRARPFPRIKNDFLGDLATAIGCQKDALVGELARLLSHRDLILLHPCVRDGFSEGDALLRYHSEWLPELLEEVATSHVCKVIQPVEWRHVGPGRRLAARLLGLLWPGQMGWVRRARQREQALALMDRCARRAHTRLPIYRMPFLDDITREHVRDFCRMLGLPPDQHENFVDTVMDGARTSQEIIQAIAEHLPPQGSAQEAR